MATFSIPGIEDIKQLFGKRKARSQMAEVFTEDGKIVIKELEVSRNAIMDYVMRWGFLLNATEQLPGEDGHWYQILWERSCYPVAIVKPGPDPKLGTLLKEIYQEEKAAAEQAQYDKLSNENKSSKVLWAIALVCATFIIIAGMEYLKNRGGG